MKKIAAIVITTLGLLMFGVNAFAQMPSKPEILIIGAMCEHKISLTLTFNGDAYADNPKKSCVVSFSAAKENRKDCNCVPKEFVGRLDGLELTEEQTKYMFEDGGEPIEIWPDIDLSNMIMWGYVLRVDKTGAENTY